MFAQDISDTMSLDDYLIENKEACFSLTVKSDSMKDAGILTGDMILVERGKTPKPNDIVIAEVDGEYKIQYFKPLTKEQIQIEAVVTAVIRKY